MSLIFTVLANLWRAFRNARVRLFGRPPDYVWLEVSGALPEFESRTGFLRRRVSPGPPAPTLEGIRERLDRISADGRPKGVVLRVRDLGADWAALEELRAEITRFRERGGRVVAYLTEPDTPSYYLACAAGEVFASPVSTVNVTGVRARVNFVKDALAQAGVEAEVISISPYKSAGDALTRNDFSEEAREQAERLLDARFSELIEAVSSGRNMTAEQARTKIDRAPYAAREALAEGLLDGVCYEDELAERLGMDGKHATLAEWGRALRALRVPYRTRVRRRIGLVSLSGAIVRGQSRKLPVPLPLVGREQAGSESVIGALRTAEKDRRIKVVLFHVDSRGGDALASDLIWREVERIRAKKPVVVLMGAAAASGGYYVSASANHVVARGGTITGSIGVIITRPIAAGLYEKLGVNPVALDRGAHAGLMDASRPSTPEELEILNRQLAHFYGEFKDRVSEGRSMDLESLERIAGGRVWTGAEARDLGLVDEVGGFRDALRKAAELGGTKDDPGALLKVSPPRSRRPTPGDPVETAREMVEATIRTAGGLRGVRAWAAAPYEVSDG
ncbi:MAG: signal peptide peptidase SppA [Rubrobacteraceae bacterium]